MTKLYLFLSTFIALFAVSANAINNPSCPWKAGQTAKISTIVDLENITWCSTTHGMIFQLVNDIDAAGFPFQSIANGFNGTFDGNNFKISNLQPITEGGLFDEILESAVVKNLTLENINVQGGKDSTSAYGGLANLMMGATAQISNVSVSGKVTGNTTSFLGGLVGRLIQGNIVNSSSSVTLVPGVNAKYNGVLVGWQQGGKIQSCTSSGTIILSGNTEGNGGIVGGQFIDGAATESPVITRSSSSTNIDISKTKSAFGNGVLAGAVSGVITDSYAHGSIMKSMDSNAMAISGGAVGYLMDGGKLENIYSSSKFIPQGDPDADGGLVGLTPFAHNDISCTNSYWDTDVSKLPYSAACSDGGRSTADMTAVPSTDTFYGWNSTIWGGFGLGYPVLLP